MSRGADIDTAIATLPDAAAFARVYADGKPQVVWTKLVADLETPVSAALKLTRDRPMSFLLESVEGGAVRGRYSVIGFEPDLIWRAHGDSAEINRAPDQDVNAFAPMTGGTLQALRALLTESAIALPAALPPMAAGVFGYMGYDTIRLVEKLPEVNPDPYGVPDAILMRPTIMVIFDAVTDELTVVTPVRPAKGITADAARAAATARLKHVVMALEEPLPHTPGDARAPAEGTFLPSGNTTSAEYATDHHAAKSIRLAAATRITAVRSRASS